MKSLAHWLVLLASLLFASSSAQAQDCILYIEQLPELPSGGGNRSIVDAVQQRLIYPPAALRAHATGRTFITFTVTAKGMVKDIEVVRGLRPDCDTAAVRAVRKLPRLKPGYQLGKPVASRLTIPVTFSLAAQKSAL